MSSCNVYISSTYRDLKDHREKVIEFFQKFPTKFNLVAMEGYVAENITPAERCLQDVAACDIYILIVAHRYGYIPADKSLNPENYSITQLEYATARQKRKQVLVFLADEQVSFDEDDDEDQGIRSEKKRKLKVFKQEVRTQNLTHPEAFVSPDSLTVQVSESLMKKFLIDLKIADQRRYCCDRSRQFNEYLLNRLKSKFKVFVIHGSRKELGRNLVNRFSIFTLNAGIKNLLPFHRFQEFMQNDYEKTKTGFIVNVFQKNLQRYDETEPNLVTLITGIEAHPYSSFVIVLQSSEQLLTAFEVSFLCRFLKEFYDAARQHAKKDIYFFLNVEDENADDAPLREKTNPLQECNSATASFLFLLPRLNMASLGEIEDWISSYLTGDQLLIEQLLEKYFSDFQVQFTMTEAEKRIQSLMQKINAGDREVLEILNISQQ